MTEPIIREERTDVVCSDNNKNGMVCMVWHAELLIAKAMQH